MEDEGKYLKKSVEKFDYLTLNNKNTLMLKGRERAAFMLN